MSNSHMKAVVYSNVGGPEVLELVSLPVPEVGCDEVRIRVRACALNLLDYYLRIEDDDDVPMPHILGSDISGEVDLVGEGVLDWKKGDEVVVSATTSCGHCRMCRDGKDSLCEQRGIVGYQTQGGYAEYVVVPSRNLARKPQGLSFVEAASIPLAGVTAYRMVFHQGRLKSGETALVMGGSSGVGSFALQLCKALSAKVITTVGFDWKIGPAKALGADHVILHSDASWFDQVLDLTDGQGVDLICEHIGGEFLQKGVGLLAQGGRLVTVGSTQGSELSIDNFELYRKQASIIGSYMGSIADLIDLLRLAEVGAVKPIIDKTFPLEDAVASHEYLEARRHFGKIVLTI